MQVRGPRALAAIAVGAALAVAGAAFQGLFRNPLVSPDILGASAGAALGAVLGIFFSFGVFGIQMAAFAGGLLAVALVAGRRVLAAGAPRGEERELVLQVWDALVSGLWLSTAVAAGVALVLLLVLAVLPRRRAA